MTAIINLEQGSAEWLAHRKNYRNASETPAVMGKSPWITPYHLWALRTGRREQEVNYAMRRGSKLEPTARAAYEVMTGHVMQPMVTVVGDYSASLDGITFDHSLIVEIKCPLRGANSALWHQVVQGDVPHHYWLQVQHQLMVSGSERAEFYVFDGETQDGIALEVFPEPEVFEKIRAAWDAFMVHIREDVPPELTERDKQVRTDTVWLEAAALYANRKASLDVAKAELDQAKSALLELAGHPSVTGGGITVTRYYKNGAVDYRKAAIEAGADLEAYRGSGRMDTRVTVSSKC